MNKIYERELHLGSEHVDCYRRLRTSTLFEWMQIATIRHTEELGVGREKTFDRGLLWVVARQYAEILRMPVYDERITLRTWPGKMLRVLFPRYYELVDADGETLVRGSALWSLMDAATRTMAFPDEHGVAIAGEETGREAPYLTKLRTIETMDYFEFIVPYSYVDLNGHMNNARYFDMVEDRLPAAMRGELLKEVRVEHSAEARLGDAVTVEWGERDGEYYVNALTDRPCFRMNLVYAAREEPGDA